jgi:hypothetical protein
MNIISTRIRSLPNLDVTNSDTYNMPMKKGLFILFLILLVACSPPETLESGASSPIHFPSATESSPPTSAAVSLPTTTPKTILLEMTATPSPLPQPTFFPNVPIESRCPDPAEVPLSDLGFNESDRLIVYLFRNGNEEQLSLLDRNMVITPYPRGTERGGTVSPDKRWFVYYVKEDYDTYELWVSSIDGETNIKVEGGVPRSISFFWTGNHTLVGIDQDESAAVLRIDPFIPRIEPLDTFILNMDEWIFAFNPDATKVIDLPYLYKRPTSLIHHDYSTGEDHSVFPGMDPGRIVNPYFLNWRSENVSLAFMDGNILELALDVPPERLAQQLFPQQRIHFPENSHPRIYARWPGGWWSNSRYLAIAMKFKDGSIDPTGEDWFYILDTTRWVLYDYCIPSPGLLYASADERFLAWSAFKENTERLGTYVLEIDTGRRTWIDDWEVSEWGSISNSAAP